jgi:hypothetical protein
LIMLLLVFPNSLLFDNPKFDQIVFTLTSLDSKCELNAVFPFSDG